MKTVQQPSFETGVVLSPPNWPISRSASASSSFSVRADFGRFEAGWWLRARVVESVVCGFSD